MRYEADTGTTTRMLFLGDTVLSDGFQLIGFETLPDPSVGEMDRVLQQLLDEKCNAFVVLDTRLSASDSKVLQRIRGEGGRIIVTEVPPLNSPDCFHCEIDEQVRILLGGTKQNEGMS
jgi:vacuolar-type H+-ATPase subunit F/Vma7